MKMRILFLAVAVFALFVGIFLKKYFATTEKSVAPEDRIEVLPTDALPDNAAPAMPKTPAIAPESTPARGAPGPSVTAISIDPAIADKWLTEEGYTEEDIADAQSLLREQGFPEDRLSDPGLIRRHLLPRLVTSVQISQLTVPERAAAGTPIPFTMKGAVPTPEFNFVRFDIVRQGDIIRPRAIGHSPAFDETASVTSRMLPVELEGEFDPLPPGAYRIIVPEMGVDGTISLIVE